MENKQRHGCVTAWLVLMIVANAVTALIYLFAGDNISEGLQQPISEPLLIVIAIIGLINVAFAVLLFQWKKWAFFGFAGTSLAIFVINISIGLGIAQSLFGLVGIAVLYAVLQIKQDNVSAWDNLE